MTTKNAKKPLTPKLERFARAYLDKGVGSVAVREAGYDLSGSKDPASTARVIASENLTRLNVREFLAKHALPAASRIEELSKTSNNSMVKLLANKDILDRAGFKPVERQVTLDATPLLVLPEALVRKNGLGQQGK